MKAMTIKQRETHKKTSTADKVFNGVVYVVMILLAFMCFYPFYYVFIYSISDPVLAQQGVTLLPKGFSLINYQKVIQLDGIVQSFMISLARTVFGTAITVVACSFFAYLVTQNLYARKVIYRFVIFTMYFNAGLIPMYLTYRMYHLTNTFWVYIIPSAISAASKLILAADDAEYAQIKAETEAEFEEIGLQEVIDWYTNAWNTAKEQAAQYK